MSSYGASLALSYKKSEFGENTPFTWFYFRIGVPAWSHVEPSAIQRIHDTEVISDSTFIYCIVSTLGKYATHTRDAV